MARARAAHRVSTHVRHAIGGKWEIVALPPDAAASPMEAWAIVAADAIPACIAAGPCTVAAALGINADSGAAPDLDGQDWWFRVPITSEPAADGEPEAPAFLVFDGLATIVDVWLNSEWLGRADNMFVQWEADVSTLLRQENELVLCARAMTTRLVPRRPRARWRSRLLASQEWRWHRTTQMGRMPGFGPALPPVGPWRAVHLESRHQVSVEKLSVRAHWLNDLATLDVHAHIVASDASPLATQAAIQRATLLCGDIAMPMEVSSRLDGCALHGHLATTLLAPWWPHTHGTPALHAARVDLELADGSQVRIALGDIGFRAITLDTTDEAFTVSVNAHPLFVRGVCWTPDDWTTIDTPADRLEQQFELLREGGVNCLRLPGLFVYPSHEFLAACDRHGMLVWQDLMFSVLDYPEHDDDFTIRCELETTQLLAQLQSHASVMAVCGNSEVAQQSAMMRVSPASLGHTLFRERLAAVAARTLPDVPYWPSTPWGGALPFQVNSGTAHYFGVGAYLRDLYDARRSQVRFTTECLGFANVPEPESLALAGISAHSAGSAEWKARSPRDGGATWDFEDVRDHYVARFFGDEPLAQRVSSPEEYLAHGRAATAMAVERTMQEFRRVGSSCHGAMIWMWTDPWLGAGWGCVDSTGRPKSVWFGLRRASRSVAIALTNEGLNGAFVHAWNDSSVDVHGTLTLRLLRDGSVETARATVPLTVPARSAVVHNGDAVLGHFTDIVHAYQFGPVAHDVVHALWLQHDQPCGNAALDTDAFGASTIIAESVLFPHGDVRGRVSTGLRVDAIKRIDERHAWLSVTCDRVTPHVRVGAAEWIPDDSYFTLVPGVRHVVRLTRCGTASSAFDPDQDCTVSDELHAVQHRDRVITIESIAALEVVHVELPPHVAIDTRVISTPSKGHA